MNYKIEHVADKNNDWKVVTLEMGPGSYQEEVSVNRTNKKGEVFPNFDNIKAGNIVEGELWQSPTGKWYLFAPKPKPVGGNKGGAPGVKAAQERKGEMIEKAQETKSRAIQIASSFRDSTMLVIEFCRNSSFETIEEKEEYMRRKHEELTKWYIKSWDKSELAADVPFKDGESSTPRI